MGEFDDKDQKTEEATPKRRSEARDEGQVAQSTELIAAVGLCMGAFTMVLAGSQLLETLAEGAVRTFAALPELGTGSITVPIGERVLEESLTSVLGSLALVTLPAIVVSACFGYLQVGFKIAPKSIQPKLSKFDLVKGAKKFVSPRSVMRTVLSALKVILITTVVVLIAYHNIERVIRVSDNELGPLLVAAGQVALRCVIGALVVILLLALVDLAFQRYQHEKDLRMTKKEVKEEQKQQEGDPHVKARIRQVQRELSSQRMIADVPEATVVVTNPTHYAVALRYERDHEERAMAPIVLAKGVDHLAERIKAVARDANVICYEDVPLARALYAEAEVGEEIPEDLYGAVATVLGYVYRLRDSATRAGTPHAAAAG